MSKTIAENVIDQARSLGARWVSFTGGEPFLEFSLMLAMVRYASEKGFYTEAVTNCGWAETGENATQFLRSLAVAGLTALNMSVDDFHQTYIPLKRVMNCFNSAKIMGLKPVFMVATRKGSKITAASISKLMGDPDIQVLGEPLRPNPSAIVMETPFTPVGRGEAIILETAEPFEETTLRCESALVDIGVTPNGDILPCCGPLGCEEESVLGNISDESLDQMLARAWKNERFTRIRDGFPIDGSYSSRCHACYKQFGKV